MNGRTDWFRWEGALVGLWSRWKEALIGLDGRERIGLNDRSTDWSNESTG